jgi:hypothetical protein
MDAEDETSGFLLPVRIQAEHGVSPEVITAIDFFDSYHGRLNVPMYVGNATLQDYLLNRVNLTEGFNIRIPDQDSILRRSRSGYIAVHYGSKILIVKWKYVPTPWYRTTLRALYTKFISIFTDYGAATVNRRENIGTIEMPLNYNHRDYIQARAEALLAENTRSRLLAVYAGTPGYTDPQAYELFYINRPNLERNDFRNTARIPYSVERYMRRAVGYRAPKAGTFELLGIWTSDPNSNNNTETLAGVRIIFHTIEKDENGQLQHYTYTLYIMHGLRTPLDIVPSEVAALGQPIVTEPPEIDPAFGMYLYRQRAYVSTYFADIARSFDPFSLKLTSSIEESVDMYEHSLELKDGKVYCYGDNRFHQCGADTRPYIENPVEINVTVNNIPVSIKTVMATKYGSLFLSNSGELYALGYNGDHGQKYLGLPNNGYASQPTKVPLPVDADNFVRQENNPELTALYTKKEKKQVMAFGVGIDSDVLGSLPTIVTPEYYHLGSEDDFAVTLYSVCYTVTKDDNSEVVRQCFGKPFLSGIPHAEPRFYSYRSPFVMARHIF